MDIACRITQIRRKLGYSQQEFAKLLSIPRPSVSEMERGRRELSAKELVKLCEITGLTADSILFNSKVAKTIKPRKKDQRFYLISAEDSQGNLYGKYGGWTDPDLSAKGINSTYRLVKSLKSKNIVPDRILSSPLTRAARKAEIIASEYSTKYTVDVYLKDRNLEGLLCGINTNYARKKYPVLVKAYQQTNEMPASEKPQDFEARILTLHNRLVKTERDEKTIFCVTHARIISALANQFLGMNVKKIHENGYLVTGKDKNGLFYTKSAKTIFTR